MLPRWMVRIHAPSLTAPSHLKTSLTHSVTKKRAAISVRSASSGRRDKSFGRSILLCLCPRENGNVSQNRIRPQDETINLQPPLAYSGKAEVYRAEVEGPIRVQYRLPGVSQSAKRSHP